MIVRKLGKKVQLVTQNDHAELSAQMAANWGSGKFGALEPYNEMVLATLLHDYGWHMWDSTPEIDQRTRQPINFNELDYRRHTGFYAEGVARVSDLNTYAGLIDVMHAIGLYTQRYGLYPNMPNPGAQLPVQEFLAKHRGMREEMIRKLKTARKLSRYAEEDFVWHNYKCLQIFDVLSLYLCWIMTPTMKVSPVPTTPGEMDAELTIKKVGAERAKISPYPFRVDPLRVVVPARTLQSFTFEGNEEFRAKFYEAERKSLDFELMA